MNGKQKLTLFFTILDVVGYKNSSRLVFSSYICKLNYLS